ncbi:MAG: D-serine ammonia-lyase [Clostridia bacterium]|nr:D-serine ammonia-lyase [Clostridia bacterium]
MDTINRLKNIKETLWINPNYHETKPLEKINGFGYVYTKAAQNRFMRFLPYIASAFPETAEKKGVIESQLIEIDNMKQLFNENGTYIKGNLFLKDDARLPIAGSVKARGGIHEVLKIAESILQHEKMLQPTDNYSIINSDEFREFLGRYTIQVGSTGNLGISIGRTAARMGFKVIVHMSSDARQWKKDLLRSEGATVKEYDGDYSEAVKNGRMESEADPNSFFIDDENSQDLFFGYSTAALRLKVQFNKAGIIVDDEHPMFVYIPCGVGGAPGGITFGLKTLYGKNVHCFFAEPTEAPCFTLGMASGKYNEICVQDIGLSGKTAADGLAVGRASAFACNMMKEVLSGTFTVEDKQLAVYQNNLMESEGIYLEPSACAGFHIFNMQNSDEWKTYINAHELGDKLENSTHIVWGTGGGLVPENLR